MADDADSRLSDSVSNQNDIQTPSTELDDSESIGGPDLALHHGMKGLYALYKAQFGKETDEDEIRQSFLRIAEAAAS